MKIIYFLFLFVISSLGTSAQQWGSIDTFTLTFSDTIATDTLYYSDTILDPQGIWVIDTARKVFFDTSYTHSPAVMTLRDSLLMPGMKGSFIISLPRSQIGGYPLGAIFTFDHKYQFDHGKAGGYVEFTIDSGRHWHGIYRDRPLGAGFYYYNGAYQLCLAEQMDRPAFLDSQYVFIPRWWPTIPSDTTSAGIACFTGTDSVWRQDTIIIPGIIPFKTMNETPMMFRFTCYADSNAAPGAGWIIDNIRFADHIMLCLGGISEASSLQLHIYPEPAIDAITIDLVDVPQGEYNLLLCDLTGRELLTQKMTGTEATIHRENLIAGSYILSVKDSRNGNAFQKHIVFE